MQTSASGPGSSPVASAAGPSPRERAQKDLIAWVSQELQELVTDIRVMARVLDERLPTDGAGRASLRGQIRGERQRLRLMVDDLLELTDGCRSAGRCGGGRSAAGARGDGNGDHLEQVFDVAFRHGSVPPEQTILIEDRGDDRTRTVRLRPAQ